MTSALLLIDIQNDYFDGGRKPLEGALAAAQSAARLLSAARERALPVFHIQHIARAADASFFLPGTVGAELYPLVQPRGGETVIQKHFPNSFRETSLLNALSVAGVKSLLIAGMMTHMCVDATVRAAADHGFECMLAGDACATRVLSYNAVAVPAAHVQAAYLAALDGTYARIATAESLITELA